MHYIRHGQSTYNAGVAATGRDPNTPDAPLTILGMEQVRAAARRIGHGTYDLIVSSPYTRALQTASLLAETLGTPVVVDALAGERRLYSCDIGTPASQLVPHWPHVDFAGFSGEDWWLPFNESHESLMKRVQAFKQKWASRHERILVASHLHFINGATGAAPENAEIVAG